VHGSDGNRIVVCLGGKQIISSRGRVEQIKDKK